MEGLRARGIRIGVLSNTIWTRDYHRGIFERDGVLDLVDADLYSSEIDHVKPHPEAFRAICRALDVDPRRAVYVGDRVFEDVHGPQQVGMRAIWIPHSDIPRRSASTSPRCPTPGPTSCSTSSPSSTAGRRRRARVKRPEPRGVALLGLARLLAGWVDAVVGG